MLHSPSSPDNSQPAPGAQAGPRSSNEDPAAPSGREAAAAKPVATSELTLPAKDGLLPEVAQPHTLKEEASHKKPVNASLPRFDLISELEKVRSDTGRSPLEQLRDCLAAINAALSKGADGKGRLNARTITHAAKVVAKLYLSGHNETPPESRAVLSKLRGSCFQALEEQALLKSGRFPAKYACEVMDAFAFAGVRCRPLFEALTPRVLRKVDAVPRRDICMAATAHGRAGIKNPALLEKVGDRISPEVTRLDARVIAGLASSFYTLGYKHDALFTAIGADVKRDPRRYSTVDLAIISTACADKKWRDESVALAILGEVSQRIPELTPRSIAALWSSFSSFGLPTSLTVEPLHEALARKGHSFGAQDISMTMNALVKMAVRPQFPAWNTLMRRTWDIINYCGMRDISELLTAMVAGGNYDEGFARKMVYRAAQLLMVPAQCKGGLQREKPSSRSSSPPTLADDRKIAQQCSRLREATGIIQAIGRTKELVPPLAHAVAQEARRLLPDLSMSDLSLVLFTLAKNRCANSDLVNAAAEKILQNPTDVRAVDIGDLAWTFAHCGVDSRPLFKVFREEALANMSTLPIPQLANLTMAFAKAGVRDDGLFHAVAERVAAHDGNFSSYSLSNLSWAYARFDIKHDPLFERMKSAAPRIMSQFHGSSLSMFMWGVSKLGYADRSLAGSIAQRAYDIRHYLNPVHITSLVGGFARMNDRHGLIFDGLAERIEFLKDALSPRELSSIAWAYATVRHRNDRVLATLADAAKDKLQANRAPAGSERESLNPQDMSTLVWAMATLGYRDDELISAIALEATKRRNQFNMQDRAIAGWAFAFFQPNYVSIVCYPALLDTVDVPTQWMQAYQAMVVSGQVSAHHEHPRYAQMVAQHEKAPDNPFEGDVLSELKQTLWGYNIDFETKVMVAGSETDIVVRRRDDPSRFAIVESDGNGFHLVQGPDGGNRVGRDIIQDRLFQKVTGSPAQHILWSEFYSDERDEHIQRVATGILKALGINPDDRAATP